MIERLVRLIPSSRYDEHRDAERFTLREAIAHLADWEPILLERCRAAAENVGSTVQAYDESARAVEMGYADSDPTERARRFADSRRETVKYLSARADEDWDGHVNHSERGKQTLRDMANTIVGHDAYHVEHLLRYLEA